MAPSAHPRLDRVARLRDGRRLAFCEWGEPDGVPVLLLHGRPGSRLLCPDVGATVAAGVRLLTCDRPGYGGSDPTAAPSLLGWVDDCCALLDEIGVPSAAIVGWSSGGPFAAACAARAPGRVSALGLAAASGPWDAVPGAVDAMGAEVRDLAELLRRDADAALPAIRRRAQWFADDPDSLLEPLPGADDDPDDRLLADPDVAESMRTWFREAARQGVEGFAHDWVAEFSPWGFALHDIARPTWVWAGEDDRLVGIHHARFLADAIPDARLVVLPGVGHLFPVLHWAEMLAALLGVQRGG